MKNKKFTKALIACLSCLLLIGVAFGVVSVAESTDAGASSAQIVYKNVAHKGAPSLVYYVKTDAPLAQNQKIKVLFWEGENVDGIYSEHNATYSKYADQEVSIDGISYYAVVAEGVAPSNVRSTLIARPVIVEADAEGKETIAYTGALLNYSIFDFVIDMLSKDGGAAADQEKLYTSLLDYAAAVQEILFTNPSNGKLNTTKLAEAGGWADAYYVVQLNRYLYNAKTDKFDAEGKYVRYYSRTPDELVTVNADLHYKVGESIYSFRGYRNMDDSYILDNNSIVDTKNGVSIGKLSLNSDVCSIYAKNPGINNFKVLYGVNNVEFMTYEGKNTIENSKTHAEFWAQYNVSSSQTKDKLTTIEITEYYYNNQKVEYFYTSDGSVSTNMNDYHYAAVKSVTNDDGTVTESLATGTIKDADRANYKYVDVNDVNAVTHQTVKLYKQGYLDLVADPLAGDGEVTAHDKVVLIAKHIYDMNADRNPNELPYSEIDVNNIKGDGNSKDFTKAGYVLRLPQVSVNADGVKGGNKIDGITATITNKSPVVTYKEDHLPVHTFETDILLNAYTKDRVTEINVNGGSQILQLTLNTPSVNSDQFYIGIGKGPGASGGRYDANGKAISSSVVAGSNGTVQVGEKLYQNTWYNFRMEYVAAGDNAVLIFYINDKLVSYVVAAELATDDELKNISFFHLNASRKTFLYLDNTTLSTAGCTAEEIVEEFNDFSEEYYQNGITLGGGKDFANSIQVDKSFKPANGLNANKVIVEEELADGTTNYALKMFKQNSTGGIGASIPVQTPGGNIYVFETDIKVIGSDNKSDWMFKFSFQNSNIASPADTQEIIMPTIGYKDPGYWTFITNYNGHKAKLKLDEWHNIRFEYNPASGVLKTWVNGVEIDLGKIGVTSTNGVKNSTASYAGMQLNIRAKNATYTELYFDNMFATTLFESSFGNGENYGVSDKYDDFKPADGDTTVTTEKNDKGEVTNTYIDTSKIDIVGTPEHALGHDYIFETDIMWNGLSGAVVDTPISVDVLTLKLFSEAGEIFSLNGTASSKEASDIVLKVGTDSAGKLYFQKWMNLKVVYSPADTTEVDGVVYYNATYAVYINNAPMYTATVSSPDVDNLKFAKAQLTIESDTEGYTPAFALDNTYTGTRYNDYYKKGQNFASSDQIKVTDAEGKTQDTVKSIIGSVVFNPKLTIGSAYTFETDYKWVKGLGAIALSGADAEFFTIKVVPSEADPTRYADLVYCTKGENGEEITEHIFTIHTGTWYNIQVVAKTVSIVVKEETEETREACMFVVNVSGVERLAVEKKIDTPFVKAVFTAETDNGAVVDNVYCDVVNSNYAGKGQYKDDAFDSYIKADEGGLLEYDKSFAETDPDGQFTDGYVSIGKNQITLGKGTAISNLVKFLNENSGETKHVFDTDINWGGTTNGVMEPIAGTNEAVFYKITLGGAEGAELLTIYAVGSYALDVAQPEIDFVQLYTSLEDVAAGKSIAALSADVWHNLRVEYATDGAYTIYVNNEAVATGNGAASATMSGVSVELGNKVYDTKLSLKYTCVTSVTVAE